MRESSDMSMTSFDEELSDYRDDDIEFAGKMLNSKDKVDQRLMHIYRMSKWHKSGTKVSEILSKVADVEGESSS